VNEIAKKNNSQITVIGAGWAGLAASTLLVEHGYKVNLIEAAQQAGGRARSISMDGMDLDNGQHIMLGAYRELRGLLNILGLAESDIFIRTRLNLDMHCMHDAGLQIRAGKLFSPLHMMSALLFATGLSLTEKWKVSRCWMTLIRSGFKLDQDMPVVNFLEQHYQSTRLQKLFWRPVCIAALNTDTDKASMQVFLNVLKRSFTGCRSNSDMLLPKAGLHKVLPGPASEFIRQNGGTVRTGERLLKINIDPHSDSVTDIETSKGNYPVSHLILATTYQQTRKLLAHLDQFSTIAETMSAFADEPITTVYMQFPQSIQLDGYMLGLCDGISQWFIDRRTCGQPGLIAAVISADGAHMQMDKETLTQHVLEETGKVFPHWPRPASTWLIREKMASFSCTPDANRLRPKAGHIGQNIWLAGDFVDTGLPATLEGAVSSGLQCARQIIN
jgi:squalene-associated FAD-dependent desaturase